MILISFYSTTSLFLQSPLQWFLYIRWTVRVTRNSFASLLCIVIYSLSSSSDLTTTVCPLINLRSSQPVPTFLKLVWSFSNSFDSIFCRLEENVCQFTSIAPFSTVLRYSIVSFISFSFLNQNWFLCYILFNLSVYFV